MITRKIDRSDWLAGHGYEWARAISAALKADGGRRTADRTGLTVICLEKGETRGLEDVEVYSLGKETGNSRWSRFWRMQKLLSGLVKKNDGIFCHQNPEYAIVAAPWAWLFGKKIVSWYVHKSVTWKTRIMLAVSSKVLTASPESFRIPSPKTAVVGHGIDTEKFARTKLSNDARKFRIVTVGRISPVKHLETMIDAVRILVSEKQDVGLDIIGGPGLPEQESYLKKLSDVARQSRLADFVRFLPPVPHDQIPAIYQNADLFLNLSQTGSIDKAVLEAMACECPVITSNEAFRNLLPAVSPLFWLDTNDPVTLAKKIIAIKSLPKSELAGLTADLRQLVVSQHGLRRLAQIIVKSLRDENS